MREEAQKEGWAKASKLQGRPMSQGLVGLVKDGQSATLVEVSIFFFFWSQKSADLGNWIMNEVCQKKNVFDSTFVLGLKNRSQNKKQ